MAARRAPVLSATSRMERSWIMAASWEVGEVKQLGLTLGLDGRLVVLGGLGWDGRGDIGLADRDRVGRDGLRDDADDSPALQAAERAGLHDLDLVAHLGLVLLVMDVKHGLAVDDLVIERVRRLVGDRDLDGLVARAARDESDLSLARIAGAGSGGRHGN